MHEEIYGLLPKFHFKKVNYYFPLYQKDNVQGSENKTKQNYLDAFQYYACIVFLIILKFPGIGAVSKLVGTNTQVRKYVQSSQKAVLFISCVNLEKGVHPTSY